MNGFLKLTGEVGVGKTRLALEIGWYLVQRHLFPHGIFYIPMRKLKKMNIYDLIEKTSQKIGFGSDKNYANFFRNKKMLLILDDFDILYSGQNEIPSLVLTMIKKSKTPVIVITTKLELKDTLDEASQTFQKQFLEIQSRIESEFVAKSFTLKRLEPNHIANIMLSLTSTSFKEGLSYDDAVIHPILLKARGIPAKIVEVINEKKLIHQGVPLEMFPYYIPFQKLTKRYRHYFKTGRDLPETERKIFALSISRHCRSFKEEAEKMMSDFASDIKERASSNDKINLKNTDLDRRSFSQPMLPHKKVAFMLNPELPKASEIKEAASKDFDEQEDEVIPEKSVETGSLNEIKESHSIKFRRSVSEKFHSNEDEKETE